MSKWIFLDFDNTLMATEQYAVPALIARFNALYAEEIGRQLTFAEFKDHFHGQARETLCQNLSNYFKIEVDYQTLYDVREWRIMQHLQQLPDGVPMAPHLIEVLTDLTAHGYKLALVSNNSIQRAFTAMRYANNGQGMALARLFGPYCFEAGDVQKPKPDVYLRAMSQVGILESAKEIANYGIKHDEHTTSTVGFAVEDSITGATAAVAAGLKTFAFTGFADDPIQMQNKLLAIGCVSVFQHWLDFPALIAKS